MGREIEYDLSVPSHLLNGSRSMKGTGQMIDECKCVKCNEVVIDNGDAHFIEDGTVMVHAFCCDECEPTKPCETFNEQEERILSAWEAYVDARIDLMRERAWERDEWDRFEAAVRRLFS